MTKNCQTKITEKTWNTGNTLETHKHTSQTPTGDTGMTETQEEPNTRNLNQAESQKHVTKLGADSNAGIESIFKIETVTKTQ